MQYPLWKEEWEALMDKANEAGVWFISGDRKTEEGTYFGITVEGTILNAFMAAFEYAIGWQTGVTIYEARPDVPMSKHRKVLRVELPSGSPLNIRKKRVDRPGAIGGV